MKNKFLDPIRQSFAVQFEYQLHFTNDLFSVSNEMFRKVVSAYSGEPVKLLFVVDGGVHNCNPGLDSSIREYCNFHKQHLVYTDTLVVPGGEQAKNNEAEVHRILEAINDQHICRHSFVVVIGGGAVIDMAGYAANIAHRGVKLIRIPTTVLAQNDAAVGVKNGINKFGKKNFIGTFATPYAIINDYKFLDSLEQRDWIAGTAEAVKVALIKDAAFFEFLESEAVNLKNREIAPMRHLIHRCAEIHMEHISQGGDPFESGSSRPLDFGHWAAHKLEQMTGYELRHGEAVAKGIALDVTYAYLSGLISKEIWERILKVFLNTGFTLKIPFSKEEELQTLLGGIEEFREHLGGELTITLINGIGSKKDVHQIDTDRMMKAVETLNMAVTSHSN